MSSQIALTDESVQCADFILSPLDLTSPITTTSTLRFLYQQYLHEPNYRSHPPSGPLSLSTFISVNTPFTHQYNSSSPHIIAAKLTHPSCPSPSRDFVGYIMLHPPQDELETRTAAQRKAELRSVCESMYFEDEAARERGLFLGWEALMVNEEFLGKGWEARFWLLDQLFVDEPFQRMGLGSRLLEWGFGQIEERIKVENERRREIHRRRVKDVSKIEIRDELVEVEGIYLLSSPLGRRTYEKAGMEFLGEKTVPDTRGMGEDYVCSWWVKRF